MRAMGITHRRWERCTSTAPATTSVGGSSPAGCAAAPASFGSVSSRLTRPPSPLTGGWTISVTGIHDTDGSPAHLLKLTHYSNPELTDPGANPTKSLPTRTPSSRRSRWSWRGSLGTGRCCRLSRFRATWTRTSTSRSWTSKQWNTFS